MSFGILYNSLLTQIQTRRPWNVVQRYIQASSTEAYQRYSTHLYLALIIGIYV